MFAEHSFNYGIFIGGMEGVLNEYEMLKQIQPQTKLFPIGSTGAAAKILYEKMQPNIDERLLTEYAYMALFKDLFEID